MAKELVFCHKANFYKSEEAGEMSRQVISGHQAISNREVISSSKPLKWYNYLAGVVCVAIVAFVAYWTVYGFVRDIFLGRH